MSRISTSLPGDSPTPIRQHAAHWRHVTGLTDEALANHSRQDAIDILVNLELTELIARSADDYVQIAAQLAADLPRLTHLRANLRSRMEASVLMDAPRFARGIESAFRAMWREWCHEKQS